MSDEGQNVEAPAEVPQENKVNVDELMGRMERLEASKKRLLDESKNWKQKYQSVKSEAEEQKAEQMRESNDFKGLYEKAQEELNAERLRVQEERKAALKSTLKYEVAKHAKDAVDVDDVIYNLTKREGAIAYDKDTGHWEGVDQAIADLRKEKGNLFVDQSRVGMVSGRPSAEVPQEKSQREMLAEDPNLVLNNILKDFLK